MNFLESVTDLNSPLLLPNHSNDEKGHCLIMYDSFVCPQTKAIIKGDNLIVSKLLRVGNNCLSFCHFIM